MRLLIGLAIYVWHKRVKRCSDVTAMRFKGHYMRIVCHSCGLHIWQRDGLFTGRGR